ncbi:N-6 DNA methylase [Streptomyces hesseae]|uniref:N-6 DNA methylase n=1 Tax=Streptomyces hesseae TaxID=3075519 RepID=A0ABU2SFP5_9ACTN|nr:N-6 DNA methylase [Streptomyces sp. DSM 40473]MDT0447801.1 N-6 DNA methylase [Streptomyces sp. DSM 40473]
MPIGIAAALALIHPKDPEGPDLAQQILAQDDAQLIQIYRQIWARHWKQRPDLIDPARILHEWINDDEHDKHRLYVTRFRAATDVLSPVMALTRSSGAQAGLGEFHIPWGVAETMGNILMAECSLAAKGNVTPGEHVHDPACGSGGLLRAAAQSMRETRHRPGLDALVGRRHRRDRRCLHGRQRNHLEPRPQRDHRPSDILTHPFSGRRQSCS